MTVEAAVAAIKAALLELSEEDQKRTLEIVLENRCRKCLDFDPQGEFWCCYDSRGD